jgi:two-component system, OmpR family, alkaline phosphatase synthesis response regulator PhoP
MSTKKKVLIIDDDNDFCEATKLILENGGFEVSIADNGRSGIDAASKLKPDLAIVDMMMETWSEGFNVVSKLRAVAATKKIKLILLSAVDIQGPYSEANEPSDNDAKPDLVLAKPIKANDLITYVRNLIG